MIYIKNSRFTVSLRSAAQLHLRELCQSDLGPVLRWWLCGRAARLDRYGV